MLDEIIPVVTAGDQRTLEVERHDHDLGPRYLDEVLVAPLLGLAQRIPRDRSRPEMILPPAQRVTSVRRYVVESLGSSREDILKFLEARLRGGELSFSLVEMCGKFLPLLAIALYDPGEPSGEQDHRERCDDAGPERWCRLRLPFSRQGVRAS